MRSYYCYDGEDRWMRVNKTRAKKLFQAGERVLLCPVNLRPFGIWRISFMADSQDGDFDKLVNAFEHYNCTSAEAGKYCAFYVKEGA